MDDYGRAPGGGYRDREEYENNSDHSWPTHDEKRDEECRTCKGTGYVGEKICGDCNGNGTRY